MLWGVSSSKFLGERFARSLYTSPRKELDGDAKSDLSGSKRLILEGPLRPRGCSRLGCGADVVCLPAFLNVETFVALTIFLACDCL